MSVFTNPASAAVGQAEAYSRAVLGLVADRDPFEILRSTGAELRRATEGMSDAEMATREAPGKWSCRHVLRHLADSEIVWAYRLRMVLAQHRPTITGYDQDAWADRLGYTDAGIEESLTDFAALRRGNLRLLERASPDDLERVGLHVERGEESVRHMIRLYAGHDVLHLRQLARIRAAVSTGA